MVMEWIMYFELNCSVRFPQLCKAKYTSIMTVESNLCIVHTNVKCKCLWNEKLTQKCYYWAGTLMENFVITRGSFGNFSGSLFCRPRSYVFFLTFIHYVKLFFYFVHTTNDQRWFKNQHELCGTYFRLCSIKAK